MKFVKILVGIIVLVVLVGIILFQTGMLGGECNACAKEGGGCSGYKERMSDRKMTAVNPLSEVKEGSTTMQIPSGTCTCGHNLSDHSHFGSK
ncbi:MAG: hypothetical protein AABZ60_09100 [Planctomycetota bacterium]